MQYDYSILEQKFKNLPEELQHALTSPIIVNQIKSIAEKNKLLIDQMSVLFDITSFTMLGLIPSSKFVDELSKEANISANQAKIIAEEINSEIFSSIKAMMREEEVLDKKTIENSNSDINTNYSASETKPPHIADLEKAGGFTIEHENSTFSGIGGEGIGIDTLKAAPIRDRWAPVQQTVVPNGTQPAPKIETTVPPKTFTPPIETPKTETIPKVDTPREDQKIEQKPTEPLADQLLSILNKPKETETDQTSTNSSTPPANLPVEEIRKSDNDTQTKTVLEKNENLEKTEEKPAFNLDSYIKKPEKAIEPTKETVSLKPVPPPIPSSPTKDTQMPSPQPPKTKGSDPYREPIQ